ncbi:MAG: hypothetical protein ACI9UA_004480, partial [Pseudoalteromonas tetraodonis]
MNFPKLPSMVAVLWPFLISTTVLAAPTAIDDAYAVNEDTPLAVSTSALIDTNFDSASGAQIPLGGDWDYLDAIENDNGGSDDYPVDGSG